MKYLFLLLLGVTYLMAQDASISVDPTHIIFQTPPRGSASGIARVTVTNKSPNTAIQIGTVTISGTDSNSFLIYSDECNNTLLANSCVIQTQFKPKSDGIKSSLLEIPYGDNGAKLSVFLTNSESKGLKAKTHLPPVVSSLDIPEDMNATTTYQLSFSALGYHNNYKILAAMFDCTGMDPGTCGASYSDSEKFYETTLLADANATAGDWTFEGVTSTDFHYTFAFTPPATRADNSAWSSTGTPIVIRFYNVSSEDETRGETTISLIIPGGMSNNYYDTSGRKIQKLIFPPAP